ncbi:MAG: FecCD family ABC transporter permease [Anaerovoracaceae bacterium]|jgi:iron complex transport system permease protein
MNIFKRGRNDEPVEKQRIREIRDEEAEAQTYAAAEEQRFSLSSEKRKVAACGIAMAAVFLLSFFFVGDLTNHDFSLAWFGQYSMRRFSDVFDLFTGNHTQSGILNFLCMFLTALLCGIALASSGAAFQAVFHNPMASPTMLGVESGGTLGTAIYIMFFSTPAMSQLFQTSYEGYAMEYQTMSILQKYGQYFASFIGCLAVVAFILIVTKISGHNRVRSIPLLVGGAVFTTGVNSVIQVIEYYQVITHENTMLLVELQELSSGKYHGISIPSMLVFFAIPVLVGFVLLLIFSKRLNVIALGDEEAKLMGISIERDRILILVFSTLMTAAVVSFCGTIGFVGLIVPHLARNIVGSDFRHLIPASAFIGAIFMILSYDISYMCRQLIDTSVIINTVGGVIFLYTMIKYRRQGNADWA